MRESRIAKNTARFGQITARPSAGQRGRPWPPGLSMLSRRAEPIGLLRLPSGYRPDHPAPLLVLCHGAGGTAAQAAAWLGAGADAANLILMLPQSKGTSWDVLRGGYGPDVERIDLGLAQIFETLAVDPNRIGIGGFSDGASFALSLGLINGTLFQHVLAFSPGFAAPTRTMNRPRFFVSHGEFDPILPVQACGRGIVATLRSADFDVTYREFPGGHIIPPDVVRAAVAWFVDEDR